MQSISQLLQGGDLFIAVGSEPFDISDFATGIGSEFVCVCVCVCMCVCVVCLSIYLSVHVFVCTIITICAMVIFTFYSSQNQTMPQEDQDG